MNPGTTATKPRARRRPSVLRTARSVRAKSAEAWPKVSSVMMRSVAETYATGHPACWSAAANKRALICSPRARRESVAAGVIFRGTFSSANVSSTRLINSLRLAPVSRARASALCLRRRAVAPPPLRSPLVAISSSASVTPARAETTTTIGAERWASTMLTACAIASAVASDAPPNLWTCVLRDIAAAHAARDDKSLGVDLEFLPRADHGLPHRGCTRGRRRSDHRGTGPAQRGTVRAGRAGGRRDGVEAGHQGAPVGNVEEVIQPHRQRIWISGNEPVDQCGAARRGLDRRGMRNGSRKGRACVLGLDPQLGDREDKRERRVDLDRNDQQSSGRPPQDHACAAVHGWRHVVRVSLDLGAEREQVFRTEVEVEQDIRRGRSGHDRGGGGAKPPADRNIGVGGERQPLGHVTSRGTAGGGESPVDQVLLRRCPYITERTVPLDRNSGRGPVVHALGP